ncbi:alpha-2-macroglobulin family protein [Patescibacteria group bacterium]
MASFWSRNLFRKTFFVLVAFAFVLLTFLATDTTKNGHDKTLVPEIATQRGLETNEQVLSSDDTKDIAIGSFDQYSVRSGVITLSSQDEPAVKISTKGFSGKVAVEVYEAEANDLLGFLVHDGKSNLLNDSVDTNDLNLVAKEEKDIEDDKSDSYRFSNSFRTPLPISGTGIWYVRVSADGMNTGAFVVVSDFGVILRETSGEYVFWGQKFSDKRSVRSGNVKIYNLENNVTEIGSSDFDTTGIARTSFNQKADVGIAISNGNVSFIPINLRYLNYNYSYDLFHDSDRAVKIYTFTDRPIYQPGDKVYFKSIVRDDNDARYTIPAGTAKVTLSRSSDEIIYDGFHQIDENGTVSGEINIPKDAKTSNYYELNVNLAPDDENNWGLRSYTYLGIEHYRKPEYFLDVNADEREHISGDQLGFTISGSYFFGQPIVDGEVKYVISKRDTHTPNHYDSYVRNKDNDFDYWGYWGSDSVSEGTLQFDDNGEARLEFEADHKLKDSVYTVEASFIDASGNPSVSRANVLVHANNVGIYRSDNFYGFQKGSQAEIKLKLISHKGGNIGKITLDPEIKGTRWTSKYDSGSKTYKYEKKAVEIDQVTLNLNQTSGEATVHFTPTEPGSYELRIKGSDDRGNEIERSFHLWVREEGQTSFYGDYDQGLHITSLREQYSHDDSALLQIDSTIPDRDILLTFDRLNTNRYQVVKMNGNSEYIEVPLVETDIPNIFAKATSFSSNKLETSSVNLKLSTDPKVVDIELSTNQNQYGPGENVTIHVSTKDITGEPLSTNTALWVVDKAIFELAADQRGSILEYFWRERYDSSKQAHSLQDIGANAAEMGGCFASGTKIYMSDGSEKQIQDVEVGDRVLTRKSEANTELVEAVVNNVFEHDVAGYFIINDHLRITPTHRMFVNNSWEEVSKVQIGDKLFNSNGEEVVVEFLQWQRGKYKVYNLEIDTHKTFFADGYWVHNDKGGGVRSVFSDTAYWNSNIQTNADGHAQITFTLPDNLTTWVITSVGSTKDTKVGEQKNEILVTKDIVNRPILPNLLRIGDNIELSTIVQNFTSIDQKLDVTLDSKDINILSTQHENVTVEPKRVNQFFWSANSSRENNASELVFSALPSNDTIEPDIIKLPLPVIPFGFTELSGESAEGNANFDIKLSEDSSPQKSEVTLSIAPSLFASMPAAMKYLVKYPYGCVEQTTSRFVPAVIAKSNTDVFGNSIANKNIDDIIQTGVDRLRDMQNPSGGWSWWHSSRSNPFISVYVTEYLLQAQSLGFDVVDMLNSAKSYFERGNQYTFEGLGDDDKNAMKASQKYGLALFGLKEQSKRAAVDTEKLTPDILAYHIMADVLNDDFDENRSGLKRLKSLAKTSGSDIYWESGKAGFFGSKDGSTALAIRAMVAAGDDSGMITQASRYLLRSRRQTRWANSFATAQVLQAGIDSVNQTGEFSPNYSYMVKLDGERVTGGRVTSAKQVLKEIVINGEDIKDTGSEISIEKSGEGQIYSSYVFEDFHTDREAKAVSNGLTISREYVNERGYEYGLGVGDVVTVELTLDGVSEESEYIVIEDQLPSGLIPINPHLDNQELNNERRSYYYYGIDGREITENGMVITVRRFRPGDNKFTYKARVVSEGEFYAPPATASMMYSPEIHGFSDAQKVTVEKSARKIREPRKEDEPKVSIGKIDVSRQKASIVGFLIIISTVAVGSIIYKNKKKAKLRKIGNTEPSESFDEEKYPKPPEAI